MEAHIPSRNLIGPDLADSTVIRKLQTHVPPHIQFQNRQSVFQDDVSLLSIKLITTLLLGFKDLKSTCYASNFTSHLALLEADIISFRLKMPYLPTSQAFLEQSSLLMEANPDDVCDEQSPGYFGPRIHIYRLTLKTRRPESQANIATLPIYLRPTHPRSRHRQKQKNQLLPKHPPYPPSQHSHSKRTTRPRESVSNTAPTKPPRWDG
jgi:hypothetical protein